VGATAITQAFGNVGELTAAELRARALGLLDAIDNGLIDPLTLDGLSREDIERIITSAADAADAIDELGESSRKAT
jgi:hypothetical protein